MSKNILIAVLLLIFGISLAAAIRLNSKDQSKPISPTPTPTPQVANFIQTGNLVKDNPGMDPGTWYLVCDAPGSPASTVKLDFNSKSLCQPISCDELTPGTRVRLRGDQQGDLVFVQKIEVVPAQDTNAPADTGNIKIDWGLALGFLRDCSITKAFQSHSRTVVLYHQDGRVFTTTEPEIDDIMDVINQNADKCGQLEIATE